MAPDGLSYTVSFNIKVQGFLLEGGCVKALILSIIVLSFHMGFASERDNPCSKLASTFNASSDSLIQSVSNNYEYCENSHVKKPKFILFMLHGLKGDVTTFGDFKSILETRYPEMRVVPLSYPTGHAQVQLFDFRDILYAKVLNHFREFDLNPNTPYGFLVHSQGGYIATSYALQCITKERRADKSVCGYNAGRKKLKKFAVSDLHVLQSEQMPPMSLEEIKHWHPANLQLLLTLGTPHHGSPMAATVVNSWYGPIVTKVGGISFTELESMSFGSVTARVVRTMLEGKADERFQLPADFDIYNIAGDIRSSTKVYSDKILQKISSYAADVIKDYLIPDRESDMVVETPDARFDYISVNEVSNNEFETKLIANASKFMSVDLPHFNSPIEIGIARIYKKCQSAKNAEDMFRDRGYKDEFRKNAKANCPATHPAYAVITKIFDKKMSEYGINHSSAYRSYLKSGDLFTKAQSLIKSEISKTFPVKPFKKFSTQIVIDVPSNYARSFTPPSEIAKAYKREGLRSQSFQVFDSYFDVLLQELKDFLFLELTDDVKVSLQTYKDFKKQVVEIEELTPNSIKQFYEKNNLVHQLSATKAYLSQSNFTYFHQGTLNDNYSLQLNESMTTAKDLSELKTATLKYKIKIPGWHSKEVKVPVAASYKSVATVTVSPYLPIASNSSQCFIGIVGRHMKSHRGVIYPKENSQHVDVVKDSEIFQQSLNRVGAEVLPEYTLLKIQKRLTSKNYDRYKVETLIDTPYRHYRDYPRSYLPRRGYIDIRDVDVLEPCAVVKGHRPFPKD